MVLSQNEDRFSSIGGKLACVFYLVLFPIFFAYHLLAALGVMPLFAGAWWGASTLVCLLVLGFLAARKSFVSGPWIVHGPVVILAALVAVCAIYYRFWGHEWQQNSEMFTGSVKLLIAWGGLYSLGFLLEYDERLKTAASVSLWAMACAAFFLIDPFDVSFIPTEWKDVQPGIAGYQWFSQAVLFTGILVLSYERRPQGQIVSLAVMDATLFLTASRADLLAALVVTFGWFVIQVFRRRYLLTIPAAVALFLTALFVYIYPAAYLAVERAVPKVIAYFSPADAPPLIVERVDSDERKGGKKTETIERYAEIGDLASSPSMHERSKYFWSGWESIKRSPLTGDYGGQIRDYGEYGTYMHNVLGVWRDYGIISFAIFAMLTAAVPLVAMWRVLWDGSDDPMWVFTLYAGGVILISALAVKSVYWPLPALGWGLLAASIVRERRSVASAISTE
ncbi:hypothetical protein [Mesorhizobium retamae]|uniref:O-antigen ligase domain-containing protein n=1 Tax=Mesorhizobium retamae TaxID=2912854 RepID=A0ABS9QHX1_9HYPH|nr:hypothetical protein [Mesorhizobium sp. IRAMC:0171]MCG7507052.1 hypothetical protein [Mesorhizobium sp. IRAMC:0171]